jgi:hypothetical protein
VTARLRKASGGREVKVREKNMRLSGKVAFITVEIVGSVLQQHCSSSLREQRLGSLEETARLSSMRLRYLGPRAWSVKRMYLIFPPWNGPSLRP